MYTKNLHKNILVAIGIIVIISATAFASSSFFAIFNTKNANSYEISVFVGKSDENIQISLNNFLMNIPSTIKPHFFYDLKSSELLGSVLVIFGHGTNQGVEGVNRLILWPEVGNTLASSGIANVFVISCDGSSLKNYVPENINIFSQSGPLDAVLGGISAAAGVNMLFSQLTSTKAENFLTIINKRMEQLSNGAEFLSLGKYYQVHNVRNTIFGVPYEQYTDLKIKLDGADAQAFYVQMTVDSFFAELVGSAIPGIGEIVFAIDMILNLYISLIESFSPAGTAYFGIRAQILPIPIYFALLGSSSDVYPATAVDVSASLAYSIISSYNTHGSWVPY